MSENFWKNLSRPILCQAPLEDVSDGAFRAVLAEHGKPDVMFTEFTSADALCSAGKESALVNFIYSEAERPIVAQIFGSTPQNFYKASAMIRDLGFDGIDINMGCPDDSVTRKQKAGASLIRHPALAKEIIQATREGGELPVSVKTRTGYDTDMTEEWMEALAKARPQAILLHGRTKKQMSKVPADWDAIQRGCQVVKAIDTDIAFIGNGDVKTLADAYAKADRYGVDGIMVGRALLGNPWFFSQKSRKEDISLTETLRVMLRHAEIFDTLFAGKKPFVPLRKHFSSYIRGFSGAKELREKLVMAHSLDELRQKVEEFVQTRQSS